MSLDSAMGLLVDIFQSINGSKELTLEETYNLLKDLRSAIQTEVDRAVSEKLEASLEVVAKQINKYNKIIDLSSTYLPPENALSFGAFKKNLDATDKIVIMILDSIFEDISKLKNEKD